MKRRNQVTLIGPIQEDKVGAYFEVMSANGGAVRLDYGNRRMASVARTALSKTAHAHRVPTPPLFEAVKQLFIDHLAAQGDENGEVTEWEYPHGDVPQLVGEEVPESQSPE